MGSQAWGLGLAGQLPVGNGGGGFEAEVGMEILGDLGVAEEQEGGGGQDQGEGHVMGWGGVRRVGIDQLAKDGQGLWARGVAHQDDRGLAASDGKAEHGETLGKSGGKGHWWG